MANKEQILDKIQRNAEQLGLSGITRASASSLEAEGITITYSEAQIDSPMGGIDDSSSPFLGIGIANPGSIEFDTDPATLGQFRLLRIASGFANDIIIPSGRLEGHSDLLGMGQ
jgi:hypothetical protein